MFYQQKAQKVFAFLKTNLPQFSIEHKWDSKLEAEWYFLQYERLQIRVLVPKIFFESNEGDKLESKLKTLHLISYIRRGESDYIVISNSGLNVETF